MYFENEDQLLQRAAEVSGEPYLRLCKSAEIMGALITPYLRKFGASEEETDRLVGHNGLRGEVGNSLGQWLAGIHERFQENRTQDRDGILQRAFFLSVLEHTHSKYSRHGGQNTHENVIAACNRVIDDIGQWTDEHVHDIDPHDRLRILNERHNFAQALHQIYDFSQGCSIFFQKHDITSRIPPRYLQAIQQQVESYDMGGP